MEITNFIDVFKKRDRFFILISWCINLYNAMKIHSFSMRMHREIVRGEGSRRSQCDIDVLTSTILGSEFLKTTTFRETHIYGKY